MFKTRTSSSHTTTLNNPRVDFDYPELTKSARLFLGKEKADALIEAAFKSDKDFLLLLAHMEHAARYYRENPDDEPLWAPKENEVSDEDLDAPFIAPKKTKPQDPKLMRQTQVNEFLQTVSLRTEKSYRLNLPYRLRCEAQVNGFFKSQSEVVRDENAKGTDHEFKLRIRIATADLPGLAAAVQQGQPLELGLTPDSPIPNRNMPVEIVWGDELPHRPEAIRQVLGRKTNILFEKGKEDLTQISKELRGAQIHLLGGNNCQVAFKKSKAGKIQLEFTPQVEMKQNPFQAFESEVALMEYLSEQYSCSPQEFVAALPKVSETLRKDLEKATNLWLTGENDPAKRPSEQEVTQFLQEYANTCLTLQNLPTPLGSISLNRIPEWKEISGTSGKRNMERAKSAKDIQKTFLSFLGWGSDGKLPVPNKSKENPLVDSITDGVLERMITASQTHIASVSPASVGSAEWAKDIAARMVDYNLEQGTPKAQEAIASSLGMSPETLQRKRRTVLENFYQVGNGAKLDHPGYDKAVFLGYALTEEEREEFFEEQRNFSQAEFESKGDAPLNPDGTTYVKPEIRNFIESRGTVELEIPTSPVSLHRLTRYPTGLRSSGKDVAKAPYGSAKHLPRDRGQKNNSLQDLALEDMLTPAAIAELKEKLNGDNPDPKTVEKIEYMRKTIASWNRGHGLILSNRPSSPVDSRVTHWINGLIRSKRENTPTKDSQKCNTVGELYAIVDCLSRIAGMKVGGIDTPLLTQPLPSVSSTIPLQLLCGVNPKEIEELQSVHKDPLTLRDMEARWENGIRSDVFHDPEPGQEQEALDALVAGDEKTQLELAIESVLSEEPDYMGEFLRVAGLGQRGVEGIDPKLQPYRGILPMLKSSPLTIRLNGEEMNLSSLYEQIVSALPAGEEEKLTLTKEELAQIDGATQRNASAWGKTLREIAETLHRFSQEKPLVLLGGKNTVAVQVPTTESENKIENVSEGLADALMATEEEAEKSGLNRRTLISQLAEAICHPANKEITLLNADGTVHSTFPNDSAEPTEGEDIGTIANNVLTALKDGSSVGLSQEENNLVAGIRTKAENLRLIQNAEGIAEILRLVPKEIQAEASLKTDFTEALSRMETVASLEKSQRSLAFQIKNWGGFEDTHHGSIESAQVVFDFQRELEFLTRKAFDSSKPTQEALQKRFVLETAEEARKVFLAGGEDKAKAYLNEKAESFFTKEKEETIQSSIRLLQNISQGIEKIAAPIREDGSIDSTLNPELAAAVQEDGIFHKVTKMAEFNRTLSSKIFAVEKERQNTPVVRVGNQIAAPKPKPLLPPSVQKGAKENVAFQLDGEKIITNKIWVADWLDTQKGRSKLEASLASSRWIGQAENGNEAKERIAFLLYLKVQGLQKESLTAMKSSQGAKALNTALEKFQAALKKIRAGGEKKLETVIAATIALSQLDPDDLLGKDNALAISNFKEEEEKTQIREVTVSKENIHPTSKRVPSPFLDSEDRATAQRGIRHEGPKTKPTLRQVRSATEILQQQEI